MKKFNNQLKVGIEILDTGSRLFLSDCFCAIGGTPALHEWLDAYSGGIVLPLRLASGTPYQQKVMLAMQQIPFGQTVSYGELAAMVGNPKGARAIGNACNKNPFPLLVPCHRVVSRDGSIGGFAYDLEIKRRLLEFEAGRILPQ